MAKAQVNYTDELVAQIVEQYNELGNDGMEQIALDAHKSVRSVRAKLVREGVYVAPVKPEKVVKDEGPSKKDLLSALDEVAPFATEGFENATKGALSALLDYLSDEFTESDEDESDAVAA